MERSEPSRSEGGIDPEVHAWLTLLTEAVDMLLRRAERQVDSEIEAAFTAGQSSTVLLREIERDQTRQLREQLRLLRSA